MLPGQTESFPGHIELLPGHTGLFPGHTANVPSIQKVKEKIINEGAIYSSMTGTGSTVYGIFKEEPILSFKNYTEKIIKL